MEYLGPLTPSKMPIDIRQAYEYLVPPWKHQLEAIHRARGLPGYGLFFEMGAGKTSTTINILRERYAERGRVLRTLVFGPPIVLHNWKREFGVHSKIHHSRITVLHGPGKQRVKLFNEFAFRTELDRSHICDRPAVPITIGQNDGHIFITNYESLSMDELFKAIQKWQPEALVFDECHRLKDRRAQRSKLADALANPGSKKAPLPRPLVYCLSGSPILNDAMDIFQQYKILDGGEAFGKSFMEFRMRYFRDKNAYMDKQRYFPNWVPIQGAMEEISKRMDKSSMRVLKKDCLDLPPLVRKPVLVEMTPQQRKIYEEMLNDLVTFFQKEGENHAAVATMALTKSLRLMQLASGYVKTDAGVEVAVTEGWSPKQEALYELLSELTPHSKVLVWAVWKENYRQIREVLEALKIGFVEVHGDVGDKQKFENLDALQNNPEVRVLLGHPGSGGIGCNMVAASYSIFFSRNFSLEQDLQAEARNHRGGSEVHDKITRIDLVAKDSIEEAIVEALARKQTIGAEVLKSITLQFKKS